MCKRKFLVSLNHQNELLVVLKEIDLPFDNLSIYDLFLSWTSFGLKKSYSNQVRNSFDTHIGLLWIQ